MSRFLARPRLYRFLLFLYPAEFRHAYADEMCLLFREMCVEERRRRGRAGLLRFWLMAFADLLWSAFLLHGERVAVSALAGASATLLYAIPMLLIEPRVSCASCLLQTGRVTIGLQGALATFAFGWMCVLCGFLFFARSRPASSLLLNTGQPAEAAAGPASHAEM